MVRKVKESLKAMKKGDTETQLRRILFKDHITPSTSTGHAPSELLFGRRLCSALTLLRPQPQARIRQDHMVLRKSTRTLRVGDPVFARNFGKGEHWIPGVIAEAMGTTDYQVDVGNGRIVHRHIDHMKLRHMESDVSPELLETDEFVPVPGPVEEMLVPTTASVPSAESPVMESSPTPAASAQEVVPSLPAAVPQTLPQTAIPAPASQALRRSMRDRKPPERLMDYQC